jgi:catechol 2,3-dioxygenase-like lactoylglutathione lyase family enzyme
MLANSKAYSGFAVDDMPKAEAFYSDTLGLNTSRQSDLLILHHADGRATLVYPKPDHEPGNYTILNFPVEDIDAAVDGLTSRGVTFERYEGFDQDDKGIFRGLSSGQGPDIAWFKDPAGNILSVLKEE